VVEAAIRNESVATLAPLVVDYLEGRRRRGGLARPGMGAQKALRLGRRGLSRKNISLTAIEAIMHKWGVDVYMSTVLQTLRHLGRLPLPAVPPATLAAHFSVETTYPHEAHTPIGAHKPYRFLNTSQLRQLMRRCPPVRTLLSTTANESASADSRMMRGEQQRLAGLLA
jgi:hypothetical protein